MLVSTLFHGFFLIPQNKKKRLIDFVQETKIFLHLNIFLLDDSTLISSFVLLSLCSFFCMSICLSVCSSIRQSIRLSDHLSVPPSIHPSLYPSIHQSGSLNLSLQKKKKIRTKRIKVTSNLSLFLPILESVLVIRIYVLVAPRRSA